MTSGTYLLCGLFLFIQSCVKKENRELQAKKNRIDTLYNSGLLLYDFKPDSALDIGREVLRLARDAGDSERVVKGYTNIGYVHYIIGDYPQALDTFQLALTLADSLGLEYSKAALYNHIGNIYKSLENFDTALQRYQTAFQLALDGSKKYSSAKQNNAALLKLFQTALCHASMNLGYVYEKKAGESKTDEPLFLKFIDLATHYEDTAMLLSVNLDYPKNRNIIANNLGKIQRQKGNNDSAIFYFNDAISLSWPVNDTRGRGESHIFMAELYDSAGMYDSAIVNARQGLQEATASSYKRGLLMASSVLAHAFDTCGDKDSALLYYKMKSGEFMALFNTNKVQQVQFSAIEHRDRENKRAKEKAEEAKKDNDNLNRYFVTFVVFFSLVFLVFKIWKKARSRWLGIAGTVIILMSFELLNEFIHSGIEHLLEKSAWAVFNKAVFAWFFLIAVVLAICFNLLHHWLEHWVKSKLSIDKKDES